MMNKSSQYCVALIKMKILKTKGGDVPKKFFSKRFGLSPSSVASERFSNYM